MTRRIGEQGPAVSQRRLVSSGAFLSRASSALASPLSALIVVPALVVVVGLLLTLLADRALRGSNLDVARERLADQSQLVASGLRGALGQADPMLERLAGLVLKHDARGPLESMASGMADLMQGRPGVAYVSASFPDGTFQGTYLDDDGKLRFQHSYLDGDATQLTRYDLGSRGVLVVRERARTAYDPRKRGFYTLAVQTGKPVWTQPYTFYTSHRTGVTRALAVYTDVAGQRLLHAVLTVDYDIDAMSQLLTARSAPGMRAVVYARDGSVLAYAGQGVPNAVPKLHEDRTLRFSDLRDPVMGSFFAESQRLAHAAGVTRVVQHGVPYLAALASASDDAALGWHVAYLAPESGFLQELYRYREQSLWVSGAILLVALLVAYLFARHFTRARREIQAAREEAKRARDQVRELGSYRLVQCLGRGGMGEVWRAEHRLLAREAAVKLINTRAKGSSEELSARFRREAQALASLRSRNTIQLYDYGLADDGTFFLVMELLDGLDVESLVEAHGAQPWQRVVPLLIQVCASLAEAHDAGLVHRDIKPANIFVCRIADELDVVKVLDFGLVRTASSDDESAGPALPSADEPGMTQLGAAMGTPGFMPPEQLLGHALTGRADLYALGCVAYYLLSGKLLFEQLAPSARILAAISEEPPPLSSLVSDDVPEALTTLIHACLGRLPEQRPTDARAMAAALRAIPVAGVGWSDERLQAFWRERVQGDAASVLPSSRTMRVASSELLPEDPSVLKQAP